MILSGVAIIEELAQQAGFSAKLVFNDMGAIFFPSNFQPRDQKGPHICYEDDYLGNALAAMIAPGRIGIRYHRDFADERVAELVEALLSEPRLAFMPGWQVTYQGRRLGPGDVGAIV